MNNMFKKAISLVVATLFSMVAMTTARAAIVPSAGDDMSNYSATISSNYSNSIDENAWYVMQYTDDWSAFIASDGSSWSAVNNGFFNTKEYADASSIQNCLVQFPGKNSIRSIHSNYLSLEYLFGWSIGSSSSKSTINISTLQNGAFYIYNQIVSTVYLYLSHNESSPIVTYYRDSGSNSSSTYRKWCVYPVAFKEKTAVSFPTETKTVSLGDAAFKYEATAHPMQHTSESLAVSSYTSSNTKVARVANDGTITIVGAGDAVITATYNGTSDYVGSEGSYTLHVSNDRLWASTQDIVSGTKYLVVYQVDDNSGYALDASQTSTAKIAVSIKNKVISTSETYAVTITKNGNYYRMLAGNGNYINPIDSKTIYGGATDLLFSKVSGGFTILKKGTNKYFSFEDSSKRFYTSSSGKCLYLYTPVSASFDETNVNLKSGETIKKVPTVTPASVSLTFTYASSDTNIAVVASDGTVTAKNMGTATITATCGPLEASYQVTVTSKTPNLQFATVGGATSVAIGNELATTSSRDGNGVITYESSDETIATINEQGVIKGVGKGRATLTAKVAESNPYTSQSKSVEIEVTLIDPLFNFSTENVASQIAVGDQLKTRVSYKSEAEVSYSSSNTGVATIDSKGVITGEGVGTAVITATIAEEGAYAGATKTITVTVVKRTVEVEPSFTTKTIHVGGTTVLKLLTNSTGNQHFASQNPAVATINASTGEITGIAEGTATIEYWIDANAGYEAVAKGTVTVVVSNKPEPIVDVNPSSVSLAIGGRKEIVVDLGDYTGTCSAVMNNSKIATVSEKSFDATNHLYVYSVDGVKAGETFLTLMLDETNEFLAKEINVPVNVLSIYQYELTVVNAPANGVAIQIWGITYTGSTSFNSSHSSIVATDVNVRYLPSYSAEVAISGRHITVTYSLKEAAKGTFLRLKNYSCGKYATLSDDGNALGMAERGMDNIIYFDEAGHFLFYQNGQFVKDVNKMASVAEASDASIFTFTRGTGDYSEGYTIQVGSQYLLGSAAGTTIGESTGSAYAYWHLEALESLPVRVSANGYGYATLFSPVELEVPGGLAAYYIKGKTDNHDDLHTGTKEYLLQLEQLMSVIPAQTPVVLVGVPGTTYDCPIKGENNEPAPTSAEALTGHFSAQNAADVRGGGTVYALQASKTAEAVGFYPWTQETIAGFKCYFVETNANPASYYRFVFDDDSTSGLNESPIEMATDYSVYNLHGQRVADNTENLPKGIYLVRGRKVLVK